MRYVMLLPLLFLGLAGCVSVERTPAPATTTYVTPMPTTTTYTAQPTSTTTVIRTP